MLQITNNVNLGKKTFYIFAKVSTKSINYSAINAIEMTSEQLIPITAIVTCEPFKTEIFEGNYTGIEGKTQTIVEGD